MPEEASQPTSIKEWWRRLWFGKWTQSRLMSRKWLLVACSTVVIVVFDATGHGLSETTLNYLQNLHIAFLSIQGGIDLASTYLQRTTFASTQQGGGLL